MSAASRKRAGFVINGAPARAGTVVMNAEGEEVGIVTSGSHSPMLKKGIGMCYVKPQYNKVLLVTHLTSDVQIRLALPFDAVCRLARSFT